jgi:hypothetical protein
MLVAVVLVLNPEMPEFLVVVAAQVPQAPMVAMLHRLLATVELAFCGSMVIIMPVEAEAETGQQPSVLATAAWVVAVVVVRRVPVAALLVQPAPEEVLHLTAAQLVQEVLLVQAILPVVPQVPILVEVVEVQDKVNINHIQEMVVLADRAQ